ncbi:MAG: DUF4130 domain-containing protein [Clostridiaceae bacterium]|nr:DUF4130 domain-containing protein [Clostridiaceae bacterium]
MILRIEDSFEGILTAAAWSLRNNQVPDAVIRGSDCPLLMDCHMLSTEDDITDKHFRYLSRIIGDKAAADVIFELRCAFLAETPGIELAVLEYIKLAVRLKLDPSSCEDLPEARAITTAARRCLRMSHSYKGILRFRKTSNIGVDLYFADIDSDCNVLPLIADHFADRFRDQNFIIRDLKRNNAVCHEAADGKTYFVKLESSNDPLALSVALPGYDQMDKIWQDYLKHLSIPERENRNLQRSNLPHKYRKHMTEFSLDLRDQA